MSFNAMQQGLEKTDKDLEKAFSKGNDKVMPEIESPTKKQTELKKSISFTIKPTNLEKLKKVAEKNGYRSASEFLDDLIEQNF